MEWVKVEQSAGFARVLQSVTKGAWLSAPAKELPVEEADVTGRDWREYTLIRIEKGQAAVLMAGDRILASCGRPGDYQIQGTEDLSKAKVYFVRTETISGKVFESNTGIVFPAKDPVSGVTQDIRLRTALYFDYRIKNPKTFLRYLAENKIKRIAHQDIESRLHSVFSVCLPDVLAQLSAEGVAYNQLTMCRERLIELMAEKLALAWPSSRGLELKSFVFLKADPYKVDEKAFLEKCAQAEGGFSAEFSKLLQELGQVAGDAITAFQGEVSSLFSDLAESLDRELQADEETDAEYDSLLDSILSGTGMDVMGTWECPELKQTVTFALLDAAIATDGKEVWRGDWEQVQKDGSTLITCPTADTLGSYAYFEVQEDGLAGVLSDTGTEKQYIRFVRKGD